MAELEKPPAEAVGPLTDGVVAIALTILVLDLEVPEVGSSVSELRMALAENARDYWVFLLAFALIAQYWISQRSLFARIHRLHGNSVIWLNFLFLLAIVAIPFSANLMSQNSSNPLAIAIFGLNLLVAQGTLTAIGHIAHRSDDLVDVGEETWLRTRTRSYTIIAIILLSVTLAWFAPSVAELAYALLFFNELPAAVRERRAARRR